MVFDLTVNLNCENRYQNYARCTCSTKGSNMSSRLKMFV